MKSLHELYGVAPGQRGKLVIQMGVTETLFSKWYRGHDLRCRLVPHKVPSQSNLLPSHAWEPTLMRTTHAIVPCEPGCSSRPAHHPPHTSSDDDLSAGHRPGYAQHTPADHPPRPTRPYQQRGATACNNFFASEAEISHLSSLSHFLLSFFALGFVKLHVCKGHPNNMRDQV